MRRRTADSAVAEYASADERDRAVEATYSHSRVVEALAGGPTTTWNLVTHHAVELAALCVEEEGTATPASFRVRSFSERHFGRQLEPALAGMLRYEVSRPTSTPARPFADWREELKWQEAAASVSHESGVLATCERIAKAAGWRAPGKFSRRMPHAPNTERRANELRQRAAEAEERS